jgi:ubiquinone/menaquinone biosynthesis C-methylase UbiE
MFECKLIDEREMLRSIDDFMIDVKRRCYGWMELNSGDRVLDVGCGLGLDVQRIQQFDGLSIDAVGVDLRYGIWDRSWEAASKKGARFVAADAALLPFSENTFDVVWSDRLLQHVDNPIRALLEFKRVSKPVARVVLADSDHTSARILCHDKVVGQRFMDFRASTIKNGSAGGMLSAWCKEVGLTVVFQKMIDIDIRSLELAKQLGLFFGRWDDKFRSGGEWQARELANFMRNNLSTRPIRNVSLQQQVPYSFKPQALAFKSTSFPRDAA